MDRLSTSNPPPWGWLTGIRPAKLMSRLLAEMDETEALIQMRELYDVSPRRAELALCAALAERRVKIKPNDAALYIGIPFCPSRCSYCSFVSGWVGKTSKLMKPFVDTLEYEMEQTAKTIETLGLDIPAVYIGGGTPTCLPPELFERVLGITARYTPNVREYTVEAGRPDTITPENTDIMRAFGVDRVSVNPQSMNAKTLERIGRKHSVDDVCKAFSLVGDFKTVNMDIIVGLPGETAGDFAKTLSEVIGMKPQNITVHTLSRKKGSDLSVEGGDCAPPGETAAMVDLSLEELPKAGYRPYYLYRQKFMAGDFENIGWSLNGHDGLYNVIMMAELATVLAAGGGGVTKLVNQKSGLIERSYNLKYPSEYNNSQLKIDNKQQFVIDFYDKKRRAAAARLARRDSKITQEGI